MRKEVKLENNSELRDFKEYDSNKLAIAKVCVLSTAPNAHKLEISEEVLRRDIGTIRGNFLVADIKYGEATTHTPHEIPVGYFPVNEPIEFEEVEVNGNKIVKAWAIAVLSKKYAKDAYEMFVTNNYRPTSIEMAVETADDNENKVISFDAYSSTILGMFVPPSCKDAEISLIRFAEEANDFYNSKKDYLSILQNFADERRKQMSDDNFANHSISTSKEDIYKGSWDGQKAKQDLVKEKNYKTLAPKVCMKLESGWENREVTKLGYPIMMLHDGKWVYSLKGLASAKGYAEKNNETEVLKKLNSIYKKLDLDEGKGDDAKMSDVKFDEIEGRKAWGDVIAKVQDHEGKDVYVDSIEDDHIIYTKDDVRYRVEADIDVDDDDKTVDVDIKWDTVKKDADQKMSEDECMECQEEVSMDEMKAKVDSLTKEIENRDNIIMDKDKELEELRAFKADIENKEKMSSIDAIMNEVKGCLSEQQFNDLKEEGVNCEMSQIDGWKNKVKAVCFDITKTQKSNQTDVWSFAAPISSNNKPKTAIEQLKEQLGQ